MTILTIICIVVFIIIASFLSILETALPGISKAKLHQIIKSGDKAALTLKNIIGNLGGVISALLMGNTFVNAYATTLGTGLIVKFWGEKGDLYGPLIMGFIIILFAEVLPKIYAIHNPERVSIRLIKFLKPFLSVLMPMALLVEKVAKKILRFFGVKIDPHLRAHSSLDELKGVIDMHHGPDQSANQERIMLKSILDLDEVGVGEIMIHRKHVSMINADEPTEKLIELILSSPYTRLPLCSGQQENILGVLHVKTFLKELRSKKKLDKNTIISISQKPWFIPESTTLLEQLQAFRQRREHFSIVVDEYGALMGIVTLEDILEEIVGEIVDEYDIPVAGIKPQNDGSYVIRGDVTIRDLNRHFEWDLQDEEAATIAGLIIWEVRKIPDVGQIFMIEGLRIEILKKERNQITLLKIILPN